MNLLFLLLGALWAATPETELARTVARARSVAQIERLMAEHSRYKIAASACRVELHEHSAPVSCYEALTLELPAPDKASRSARVKHLDRLCTFAANSLRVQGRTPSAFISSACAKSLASAREIQKYREDEGADWSKY